MLVIFYFILPFLLISFSVAVYNFLTAPRFSAKDDSLACMENGPLVSILIPARNEEENIETCIKSVLKQTYRNIEVILLNDNSADNTEGAAADAAAGDLRFRIVRGLPLEPAWLGKNWACHQLSEQAKGSILLFIDADVILSSNAVGSALNKMAYYRPGMLSVFPTQIMKSAGEYLIVPMMNWLLLSFLPLRLVYTSSMQAFTAANGQFIMVTKEAYISSGGHRKVCSEIVEDMELAKNIKASGSRLITLLGGDTVKCRMYKDFGEAYSGFSKNLFAGFKMPSNTFRRLLEFALVVFLLPFILVFFCYPFAAAVCLILMSRLLISLISRQNFIYNLLLHPVQMVVFYLTGINSVRLKTTGKIKWKDRTY